MISEQYKEYKAELIKKDEDFNKQIKQIAAHSEAKDIVIAQMQEEIKRLKSENEELQATIQSLKVKALSNIFWLEF